MIDASLPHRPTPTGSRRDRGIALFRERGEEIRHVRGRMWAIPSCSGSRVYLVDVASGICTCPDTPPVEENCKHATVATIAKAKTARCSGCGVRRRRRELVEVGEEQVAWTLALFIGDRLCPGCAREHGLA